MFRAFIRRHLARARRDFEIPESCDYGIRQPYCYGCSRGCYAPEWLPGDWRDYANLSAQACAVEDCSCWGGDDEQCESCWLDTK